MYIAVLCVWGGGGGGRSCDRPQETTPPPLDLAQYSILA